MNVVVVEQMFEADDSCYENVEHIGCVHWVNGVLME